jgi:signal transduction histidine kinase
VTDQPTIERLAALPTLSSIPRAQLEWLVAHGSLRHYPQGELITAKGQPIQDLFIILTGRISIRLDRGGIARIVKEWTRGDVSGYLPYSRLAAAPGEVVAEEAMDALVIGNQDIRDMTRECYEFTALCVHEMLDRARQFKIDDLQREKLASLGVLSAGLAHELNNPSSALARSAKELAARRPDLVTAARELGAAGLSAAQRAAVQALELVEDTAASDLRAPLDRADREDAIAGWLDAHRIDAALADSLARSTITIHQLDAAAAALERPQLAVALRYVAADLTARRLSAEIERAAGRIHQLVAAVKKHTHMDRAHAVETVPLEESLSDTLTLIGSKARRKSVSLELNVEPELPRVQGVVGELGQVWLNLIDNAIDAAPEAGHVTVTARRERNSVVVRVIDDGGGIADADRDRIFEPFYTTKPVGEGSGLGLDVVQSIVRAHRGSVEVTSRPGRTEFRVCLPAAGGSESGVRVMTPTPDSDPGL